MHRLARQCCVFVPLLLIAHLGVPAPAAIAQQTDHAASGARIRLRLDGADGPWQQGTLLRASPDSLWYLRAQEGDTLAQGALAALADACVATTLS